jgi:signal transduction histidine kinase
MARRREEQDRSRLAIRKQVVAEEHTRMARELHDLVGHTVNLLVVQAGAARVMLDTDPATTRDLLTGMEETGCDALADLDQVLGTLREDSVPGATGSGRGSVHLRRAPGLSGLPDLVSRLNDSQVHVTLSVDAGLQLPRNLDLSAYRIVQEALTNVLKHAAPCSAEVAVHRHAGHVVIDVSDDGRGVATPHASGRGLIGIAERVSACGGSVEYGPGKASGFTLRVELPLP